MAADLRAMASSSLVGMTQMVTAESGVEMMRGSLERVAFFYSSSLTPNGASLSQTILRTTSSFSPTPAVKVITSTPPI